MSPDTAYVGRPSKFGNPYRVGYYSLIEAITNYECWLAEQVAKDPKFLEPLRGKNLACWCPSWSLCHADILLRMANPPPTPIGYPEDNDYGDGDSS